MSDQQSITSQLRQAAPEALKAALAVMAGYVVIGIPAGILESRIGVGAVTAFFISITFYTGAGQFMIPNMWLAGLPAATIMASTSLVGSRQMLYAASFSPYFARTSKALSTLFALTVTDESYGVNYDRFTQSDSWDALRATLVNIFCMLSWASANALGCIVGDILGLPLAIASFAMTSIFICLLVTQPASDIKLHVIIASAAAVFVCKLIGLGGLAVFLGSIVGVVVGMFWRMRGEA
ncbi:MAG: AzlC family ABC transporter permease [Atopobiaceae bacterium]|nr:AzlC family ABC transporter permease [Atopobiaceae bacterium]